MKPALLLLILMLLLACNTNAESRSDEPQFILIHLDAGSTPYVLDQMEKGYLPNLQRFFGNEGLIQNTITYFPSKTPTVISSIREGASPDESALPGWKRPTPDNGRTIGMIGTFLDMAFSKSRLSTTNLIYGLPVFHWMAGPALINTADYLKDYNIVQFYWYNVDTQGHFHGEEAYINELREFDRQFGRLAKRLDDDVNVIIYSDHGMTFGEGIEIDGTIEDLVGDDLAVFSYPTLFLTDGSRSRYYAERLIEETELDFTFIRDNDGARIVGFHELGRIILNIDDEDRINYEYEGEDLLRYEDLGYSGEYLDRDAWLELTHGSDFPMAPISLKTHFNNPNAGDIITLFGFDRFQQTGYSRNGNHGGFTSQDMTTPLFIRGDKVEHLKGRNYYWLPNLFSEIDNLDFDQSPVRERHTATTRYDFRRSRAVTEFSLSPIYRVRYGVNLYHESGYNGLDRADIWGKTDLFRSYLSRLWMGVGVELEGGNQTPLFMAQYDIHIRRFVFQSSVATNRQFYFRTSWEMRPWLAFETVNFNSIGVRFDF